MFGRIALVVGGVFLSTGVATGRTLVTSTGPEKVSVTVYQSPDRGGDTPIDRQSPRGYALITETRTIRVPAGRSVIRFEGVAGNIFPESAIIGGLPAGVREKNLDADLLSPRSLFDRALGRRVVIRRTDKASGKVVEQQAVIRSGSGGAAVIDTGGGYEGYQCSGMPEALVYPGVPAGLSAKPTLSVEIDSDQSMTAVVTLSYLAGGFDWQANYVVTMQPGGASADVFAWVTMASSDVTSFANAGAQMVAGKPNRVDDDSGFGVRHDQALTLKCWQSGPPDLPLAEGAPPVASPAPAYAPMALRADAMEIVVTGAARKAVQENLGDLKLYRITDPVTVASQSQKQVALMSKDAVPVKIVYVSDGPAGGLTEPVLTLRARNQADAGLGLPLPSGRVAVFENAAARPILLGETATSDKAVGEDVEFALNTTPAVHAKSEAIAENGPTTRYRLTVTNASPRAIAYEAKLRVYGQETVIGRGLVRRDGVWRWMPQVPANGTVTLDYSVTRPDG